MTRVVMVVVAVEVVAAVVDRVEKEASHTSWPE